MQSLNHTHVHSSQIPEYQFYLTLGVSLVLGQLALYFADPDVQFYWSDSRYYMFSVLDERIPRSRPALYGFVIGLLTDAASDLTAIVIFQILAFCATCLLFAIILRRYFFKSRRLVFFASLIASLLPAHMIWTRYVMTESVFLLLLMVFFFLSLEFLRSGKISILVLVHVIGVLAIGFRWTIIPVAIFVPIALPFLKWLHDYLNSSGEQTTRQPIWTARKATFFFAASLGLSMVTHTAYQYANSRIVIGNFDRPAYSYGNGLFLLGFLSPIVKKEDIPAYIDRNALWNAVTIEWGDRHQRERHRWDGRGIVRQLQFYVAERPELGRSSNSVAQQIGVNALLRNPFAFVQLSYLTMTDFWNRPLFESHIRHDLVIRWGPNFPEHDFIEKVQQIYEYDATKQQDNVTPLKSIFLITQDYLAVISLSFLFVPFMLALGEERTWVYFLVLATLLAFFGASSIALTSWPNARYMQVVSWMTLLVLVSFSPSRSRLSALTSRLARHKSNGRPQSGHRP